MKLFSTVLAIGLLVLPLGGPLGWPLGWQAAADEGSTPAAAVSTPAAGDEVITLDEEPIDEKQAKKLRAPWQARIDQTKRDVVLIEFLPEGEDVFTSKLGGIPYLPKGKTVPTGSTGRPLFLLAQINFAELPALPGYPKSGLLQFFIADNDKYGANLGGSRTEDELAAQKDFRVVYYPELQRAPGAVTKPPVTKPQNVLPFYPERPLKMQFKKATETINSHDIHFKEVTGLSFAELTTKVAGEAQLQIEPVRMGLANVLGNNDFVDKIGGFPSFAEHDPRPSTTKKELLLQLSSDEADGGMMWGNLGVAGFFIDPEDLKRLDFSRVVYSWDEAKETE